ncbi:hypothetical protein MmTuc01_2816 [Methanosarcina mazei Tuc01]|uniref:Uncharacterized protein n=1 Tax=Methanosarcina mazei Tuc01 TaxID=1236903 RepID=M1QCW9_METMZ|nr:hypothetical protein MmTuc01_2816 [Methanosarcina mazei Tuc01]
MKTTNEYYVKRGKMFEKIIFQAGIFGSGLKFTAANCFFQCTAI